MCFLDHIERNSKLHIPIISQASCTRYLEPPNELKEGSPQSVIISMVSYIPLVTPNTHSTNSVTLQKMIAEQILLDTLHPPHCKLKPNIESKCDILLKQYTSLFAKDETSIGTTPLTEMTIDMGTSDPVSLKPYPIAMKNYQWVKDEIEKLLTAKVAITSHITK